jgi:hypothetical protein
MSEDSKKPEFTSVAELKYVVDAAHWKMLESMFFLRWHLAKAACSRKKRIDQLSYGLEMVKDYRNGSPKMLPELAARIDAFEACIKRLAAKMVCGTVTSGEWLS